MGAQAVDAPSQGRARLVVDHDYGDMVVVRSGATPVAPGGVLDHYSSRTKRNLTNAFSAPNPSRQVIFLPSSTSRPA